MICYFEGQNDNLKIPFISCDNFANYVLSRKFKKLSQEMNGNFKLKKNLILNNFVFSRLFLKMIFVLQNNLFNFNNNYIYKYFLLIVKKSNSFSYQ